MANTTARTAQHIHGTNPQFLVEKVIRARIYDSPFWKEHCFALTAESLVDRAVRLDCIGGTYGMQKPTQFLCLLLKLLQLQPDRDVILEYLRYAEFKYLRAVAAMYVRLTFRAFDVFEILEPMMKDFRKLRVRKMSGEYAMTHMDEFIDELLTQERSCELILPRLTRRDVLEETEGLAPRTSALQEAVDVHDGGSAEEYSSDDSERQRAARNRQLRAERAEKVRRQREEGEERRRELRQIHVKVNDANGAIASDTDGDGYPSQEDSDAARYISRSQSPDLQNGGFVSRSPSQSPHRERQESGRTDVSTGGKGYRSRSISISPDRNGYQSRSVSRSPDRL